MLPDILRTLNYETLYSVIPAKAGIHVLFENKERVWIPAFAGMTEIRIP